MLTRATIDRLATELGFTAVRVAPMVRPTPGIDVYDAWIAAGHHGEMGYLARGRDPRADVAERLPEARSAVVLAWDHAVSPPPDPGGLTGRVARYAWGRDYHNLVGKRLRSLKKTLSREHGVGSWGGVDAAPILERSWARLAGLGFLGKNTLAIVPSRGSWFFLAVLFLDCELPPDPPLPRPDFCGRCTRCLDRCPTDAFPAPFSLDATRCIAYWTIEARDLPPRPLRAGFGRWFFGCDLCQEVCPHNHAAAPEPHPDLLPRNAFIDLPELLATPDEAVLDRFEARVGQGPHNDKPGDDAPTAYGAVQDELGQDLAREEYGGGVYDEVAVTGACGTPLYRPGNIDEPAAAEENEAPEEGQAPGGYRIE